MSNTIIETIANRYTARSYTGEAVLKADLETIARAGLQAPSSMNRQRWRIVVVTDPEFIEGLQSLTLEYLNSPKDKHFYDSIQRRGGNVFYNAPAIIVVGIPESDDLEDVKSIGTDAGIVVENMALAATGLGYGSCICGLFGKALAIESAHPYLEQLNLPEGYKFGISLLVGKTDTEPTPHKIDETKLSWVQ